MKGRVWKTQSYKSTTMTKKKGSFGSIFMHADGFDKLLMSIGFLAAIADGISFSTLLLELTEVVNNMGRLGGSSAQNFSHRINKNALIMCYMACGQWIACFLEGYCWTRTAERQAATLRTSYLKAVLRQEMGYFDLHVSSTAEAVASVTSDSFVIQDFISDKVPLFLMNLVAFVGAYVVSFILLWKLAIVALPLGILLVVPGLVYGKVLMGIARKMREEYSKADSVVEQAISSIRTVYSFVGEAKTMAEYSASLLGTLKLGHQQGLAKGLAIGSTGITFATWSLTSYYGSRMVMYHGAQGGAVYAVGVALTMGGLSLGSALSNVRYFSEASAAGERVMETIRRVPNIDPDSIEGEILPNVSGEVQFRHVEFAYPSRPESIIFKDFNFKFTAGKATALVGRSGSGKSTVVALLQRFYDPLRGEILLDSTAIDKLQLKWLRSQMGLVSQESALLATTIKENILFGKEDASLEEVIEAAKAANAHGFVSQLPHGYDTQVGERGVQMSGGQKQRIAIARAIIRAPKILLLDEATSALDLESERVVQQALEKVAVGVTTIIIAHRLSTIRNAGLIGVIQNGQVKETGSHDELIQVENGLYASLIRLQETETNAVLVSSIVLNNTSDGEVSSSGRSTIANSATANHKKETNETIEGNQVQTSVPSFSRLLAMNLPEWKQALAGCTSALLFGAIQPTYAYVLGSVICMYFLPDHREIKKKTEIYSLSFVGLALFALLNNICQHYNFAAMGEYLTKRIRERALSKILTFEIGWFDQDENATGAICSRLAKDANVVRSLVGDRMSLLIQTISAVTIAYTMGLIISWRLALVMIAVQPLMVVSIYSRRTILKSMSEKAIKSQNESSKIAAEAVSNIRTIAAFNSQVRTLQLLQQAQEEPRKENIRQSWFAGIGLGISNSLLIFIVALGFWYGGRLMASGLLELKAFFQVYLILMSTGRVIGEAGTMSNDIAKGSVAVGSFFTVLDRHSSIDPENQHGHKPDKIIGHVELLDVDFSYPTRPNAMIFREFSLEIEPGKSTALVGQSGSGKSTIIGLIERFYDPLKGVVKVDGRDIKLYQLRALRRHIALVSQEPALFAGTIRQNITYGAAEDIDEAEVIEAAKAANAYDFIAGLKDGYDTYCGDKGMQLSGGQKQRIAIARAVLKNPAILLLDEATSALDIESEKVVQDALDRVMMGRTGVVVAHRLSTIQNCDLIAVLDEGKVVEKGTHSSLLAKGPNGAYLSLVSLQTTPKNVAKII